MKVNKKSILTKMSLIFVLLFCGCNNKDQAKSQVKGTQNHNKQVEESFYKPTSERMGLDIAYLRLYSRIYNSPLVNYSDVLPHFNCNKTNLNNLKIFLDNDNLFIDEDYSNGLLIKRYTPCPDERFYEYQYFEYDECQRLKRFYNKKNNDDVKIANELYYEYYQDAQDRIYQFEITDKLGATKINKTSQVLIQTKTDYGFMIEEIHSFSEDMRELNYDELPEKLSRNVFLINTENGKIKGITKKEKLYNTVLEINISYSDEFINRISYTKYQNKNKIFEEIIDYVYDNELLIKENHMQKVFDKEEKEYSFEFVYSDFDSLGNFMNQTFYGSTYEFDSVHAAPVKKDSEESSVKWELSYK